MKLTVHTTRFGTVSVDSSEVFTCDLVGLAGLDKWCWVDEPTTRPFRWLQAVEQPWVAIPMLSTVDLIFEFDLELLHEHEIREEMGDDVEVYIIATIPATMVHSHVNLRSPVIVNVRERRMKQFELVNSEFPTKLYFFDVDPDESEEGSALDEEKICLN